MRLGFFAVILFISPVIMVGQCCDADAPDFLGIGGPCSGNPNAGELDGGICDPNCSGYSVCTPGSACYNPSEPSCPNIPIDGDLGLLAIAGGGLAIAAMRRRREEVGQDLV